MTTDQAAGRQSAVGSRSVGVGPAWWARRERRWSSRVYINGDLWGGGLL